MLVTAPFEVYTNLFAFINKLQYDLGLLSKNRILSIISIVFEFKYTWLLNNNLDYVNVPFFCSCYHSELCKDNKAL